MELSTAGIRLFGERALIAVLLIPGGGVTVCGPVARPYLPCQ
jgi:hypothetical protein